jgi:hypothetical protein
MPSILFSAMETYGNIWKHLGNIWKLFGRLFPDRLLGLRQLGFKTFSLNAFCLLIPPRSLRLCGGSIVFPNSLAQSVRSCKTAIEAATRSGNRSGNQKRQKEERRVNGRIGESEETGVNGERKTRSIRG